MIPLIVLGGTPEPPCDESRWIHPLFSMSKRRGVPLTAANAPTPAPASDSPLTSFVLTKPPEPASNRKTTPLPLMTVASPPPPPLPATPLVAGAGRWPRVRREVPAAVADPDSRREVRTGKGPSAGRAQVEVGCAFLAVVDPGGGVIGSWCHVD